jgi:hypothetical protein
VEEVRVGVEEVERELGERLEERKGVGGSEVERKDFRTLTVSFKCFAPEGQEWTCLKYRPGSCGCGFQSERMCEYRDA